MKQKNMSKIMRKSFTSNNRKGKTPCPKVSERKHERSNMPELFTGSGNRLGGDRLEIFSNRNIGMARSSFLDTYDSSLEVSTKRRKMESHNLGTSVTDGPSQTSNASKRTTGKEELSSSSSLKLQQDQEYEESLLREVLLSSAKEEITRMEKQQKQLEAESELLKKVQDESIKSIQYERHERAKQHILDEPDASSDGVVTIRFVLPSSAKVSRRFRVDNSVEEAFIFLRTLEELIEVTHLNLRSLINNELLIDENDIDTFRDFKILKNCNLIVLPVEIDNTEQIISTASNQSTIPAQIKQQITIDLT